MIDVVSFDYFDLASIIDFGFTPTEPWSETFDDFDYGSLNFIENLGSISIFFWIGSIYVLFVAISAKMCGRLQTVKCLSNIMKPMEAWYTLLGFLTGTFFELMLSMSIGMRNFKMSYREYFVGVDRFALAN